MGANELLKKPPENLKDAIDWIVWFWGYGKSGLNTENYRKLTNGLNTLPEFAEAKKQALGQSMEPEGIINKLGKGLGEGFLGYSGQGTDGFSDHGIAMSGYQSTYKDANWSASDTDLKQYAKIFLFLAPLVYYFVSFFYWACKRKWKHKKIETSGIVSPLYYLFNAMGYTPSQLNQQKTGSHIADRLGGHDGFDELKEAYEPDGETSYETFLTKLESKIAGSPLNRPLGSCFKLATSYFERQSKLKTNASEITAAIDDVKEELKTISAIGNISNTDNFSALKQRIGTLLGKIQSFNPTTGSSEPGSDGPQKPGSSGTDGTSQAQSSSAGPAVGGLLGVGTLGAGAAYGLNLDRHLSTPCRPPYSDCPSNLKEAIDWILRVTGKDTVGGSQNGSSQLADAVSKLLKDVKASSSELQDQFEAIKTTLNPGGSNGLIDNLATGLAKFIGYDGNNGIKSNSYKVTYDGGATWQDLQSSDGAQKSAKIFLGCVPLCFYGLSYLYWRCSDKGEWKELRIWDSSQLQHFLETAGFDPDKHLDQSKTGGQVATAFQSFDVLSTALTLVNGAGFPGFLSALLQNVTMPLTSFTPGKAFVGLHIAAQVYFTHQRSTNPHASSSPPSSIRTMLYWLSGLTVTPHFGELLDHINSMFPSGNISVAISGSQGPDTLSANDLAGHLVTSCISSVPVLRSIQGRSVSDDPLLHYIYCNSEFSYPPYGVGLFNALSAYTYALQFQLYFLHTQCSSGITTCGWYNCKFGYGILANYKSHICHVKCTGGSSCRHGSTGCKHGQKCGTGSNLSPLQAFLTDTLNGFSLPQQSVPASPTHLDNHPAGAMCHVKMGFVSKHLRQNPGQGGNIFKALDPFCGGPSAPLFQLSAKLGCLTKRTPISLGDIFGFIWHLNGQLFRSRDVIKKLDDSIGTKSKTLGEILSKFKTVLTQVRPKPQPPTVPTSHFGLSDSLQCIARILPFWENIFNTTLSDGLPGKLFDLTQHCHKWEGSKFKHDSDPHSSIPRHQCATYPADLWSLYYPVGNSNGSDCSDTQCGGYLEPLTITQGATFSPSAAPRYLSWMAYLTDDLHEWLGDMRDEFMNISCEHCGPQCQQEAPCHASPSGCSCTSVVSCAGVLPLLYRHGFQFNDAYSLNGWMHDTITGWKPDSTIKRNCQKFHTALSNVLSPDAPLAKLLESIDSFLYMFRIYFFYNLSSFWTIYICLILFYFIFFGIDVLHFKSHVHFPPSHSIPPIGLLTTGKAPALTKLTYYMP
ncbi:variant erythrocyte surface antigen-1 family protein [Babesia caballi]|uniref:Variant erythrocyte surface antigen-1 family protein n=1 Tax=Babesia caballi TaxID=5871 RepID=A0AAV4LYJ2_BABCB|nr:variant erythrocyte surface antigen-1 family protein [Babesia caballi]